MLRRTLLDTAYSLSAFPLALGAFVLAVVGVSLAAGTLVLVAGFFVMVATVYVARGFAHLERSRLHTLQGRPARHPAYATPVGERSAWRPVVTHLRDVQSWLDVLWSVLGLVTATAAFSITVAWWSAAGGGLTYWFWQRWIPFSDEDQGLAELLGLGQGRSAESWLNLAIGVVALLTLPIAVRAAAAAHAGLATALLCTRADLQESRGSGARHPQAVSAG